MGVCYSTPLDEENTDDEKDNVRLYDPENRAPADYQIESVIDSNQDSDGEVVISAPSNKNHPHHPVQAGTPDVDGHQSDPTETRGQGQKQENFGAPHVMPVNTAETGSALTSDYIEPEDVEVVKTGKKYEYNCFMESMVQSSIDEQGEKVYDSRIGRMVYVLGNNESVKGLEPIAVPATRIQESMGNWERKQNEVQQVFSLHPTEPTVVLNPNEQYEAMVPTHVALESNDFDGTNDYQMQIVSVKQSRKGYQYTKKVEANPIANEPAGIEVYDPMIGEMVQLLDDNAPLDGMEIIEDNAIMVPVNYEDIPATETVQNIRFWGTGNNRKKDCGCNSYIKKTYTQGKTLGIGGSCRVVECVKKETGKKFALKIMSRRNEHNAEQFAKEKNILQMLNHPNIMTFHEAHVDNQNFYIVSVLYEGGELFDRIADRLTETRVSKLVRTMLLTIQYCHSRNIVHRDLKPENFVFKTKAENSGIVLIDFGCAKQVVDDEKYEDLVGTPLYLAPESAVGYTYIRTGRVLKSSDIWSIGVTAYVMLTGRPPFNGQSNTEIYKNIIEKRLTFPPEAKLSRDFVEFCQLMLNKSPKRRLKLEAALEHRWVRGINTSNEKVSAEVIRVLQQFKQQSKLKKIIAKTQAVNMASHSLVKEQFDRLDKNCDGALDLNELSLLLMDAGYSKKQAYLEAAKMIQSADFNGSGEIEFNEFAQIWQRRLLSENDAYIHAVFSVLDEDNNGIIDARELGKVLKLTGDGDDKKIAQIIDEVDQDGDGVISWEEFRAAMLESGDFGGRGADIGQVLNENELPSNVEFVDLDRVNNLVCAS